mmetsp:Transcript_8662/g.14251  ORF Transcript_8662/g.14251 Transcript_8662/m.14251 type:complete len:204 (-) Transcript_8662:769-1380(-)
MQVRQFTFFQTRCIIPIIAFVFVFALLCIPLIPLFPARSEPHFCAAQYIATHMLHIHHGMCSLRQHLLLSEPILIHFQSDRFYLLFSISISIALKPLFDFNQRLHELAPHNKRTAILQIPIQMLQQRQRPILATNQQRVAFLKLDPLFNLIQTHSALLKLGQLRVSIHNLLQLFPRFFAVFHPQLVVKQSDIHIVHNLHLCRA